jgi:undecaprenyl-diphosphatase
VIVVLKRRLRRPRPALYEGRLLAFDQFSFPSGHAMNAFALGAILTLAWPQVAVPVLLVAGSIGASRVVLGFHFLSDVLAGAVLGLLVGGAAYSLIVAWR